MEITVTIPDETAASMFANAHDPATSLLELAGYTACAIGRISEREYMDLLHLDSRFDVHALMKRIQQEGVVIDMDLLRHEMATIASLEETRETAASR